MKAQITIQESEVLAKIPCGILVLNRENQIIYVNKRLLALSGKSQVELLHKPLETIGLAGPTDSISFLSDEKWVEWEDGKILRQRSCIVNQGKPPKPVSVNARRGMTDSGETRLYLCVFDLDDMGTTTSQSKGGDRDQYQGIVGKSPQMQDLYNLLEMASGSSVNVVIYGESGTGKELVASAIHNGSNRVNNPFVRINCAAISETLLESELFGHVKGAFTGAYKDRIGTFEAAHKGTILLDEIGEITPAMQAKLLRVLQERIIIRVGDNQEIPVDVRVIAATNKNLRRMVSKGKFREDLFYRLNVFPIHIPSLSERRSDIVLLCNYFLKKYSEQTGKSIRSISPDTMRLLFSYCWPGNVRELENTIEHAFVLCRTEEIQMEDLPHDLRETGIREGICAERSGLPPTASLPPIQPITQKPKGGRLNISKEALLIELERYGGNKAATARALGISSVGLWKKLKKLGI